MSELKFTGLDDVISVSDAKQIADKVLYTLNVDTLLKSLVEAELQKANESNRPQKGISARLVSDELYWQQLQKGVRAKPSTITVRTLRKMAERDPIVASIIQTRTNQVSTFCRITRREGEAGFRIVHDDPVYQLSENERVRVRDMELFFLNTGWEHDIEREDDLSSVVEMLVRDLLVLDQINIEVQYRANRQPLAFWVVDAGSIYRCVEEGYEGDDRIKFVQIDEVTSKVIAKFTADDLIHGVSNPRSDRQYRGYGLSPLELLIKVVTGFLFAFDANTRLFTDSSLPPGIFNIVGKFTPEALEAFQRQLRYNLHGFSWRAPLMAVEEGKGVSFQSIRPNNQDMQFNFWMQFLICLECALFEIDTQEIGFKVNLSGAAQLFSDSAEIMIRHSRDRGLRGILTFLAKQFTKIVKLHRGYENYSFEFVGLQVRDERERVELRTRGLQGGYLTVREIYNQDDRRLPVGYEDYYCWDMPSNPVLAQAFLEEKRRREGVEAEPTPPVAPTEEPVTEVAEEELPEVRGAPRTIEEAIGEKEEEAVAKEVGRAGVTDGRRRGAHILARQILGKSVTSEDDDKVIELIIEGIQ